MQFAGLHTSPSICLSGNRFQDIRKGQLIPWKIKIQSNLNGDHENLFEIGVVRVDLG